MPKNKINLAIELRREYSRDKQGKVIYIEKEEVRCPKCGFVIKEKLPEKEPLYKYQDAQVLMQLSTLYDSRTHTFNDYKQFMKLREKLERAWVKDEKKLELSLDEATVLKNFLNEFFDKDKKDKQQLSIFLGRAVTYILEQLEGE